MSGQGEGLSIDLVDGQICISAIASDERLSYVLEPHNAASMAGALLFAIMRCGFGISAESQARLGELREELIQIASELAARGNGAPS